MVLLLQCPSCWQDPHCPDCVAVMAAGTFWLVIFLVFLVWAWFSTRKGKR